MNSAGAVRDLGSPGGLLCGPGVGSLSAISGGRVIAVNDAVVDGGGGCSRWGLGAG
jgi:hypothetical protein